MTHPRISIYQTYLSSSDLQIFFALRHRSRGPSCSSNFVLFHPFKIFCGNCASILLMANRIILAIYFCEQSAGITGIRVSISSALSSPQAIEQTSQTETFVGKICGRDFWLEACLVMSARECLRSTRPLFWEQARKQGQPTDYQQGQILDLRKASENFTRGLCRRVGVRVPFCVKAFCL